MKNRKRCFTLNIYDSCMPEIRIFYSHPSTSYLNNKFECMIFVAETNTRISH